MEDTINPTVTVDIAQLAAMLNLPANCRITDLWTTDYDTKVTVEYTE